jgi:hypothetical protein
MPKITQAIAPGRRAWIVLLGTATLALAACGDDQSGSDAAATTGSTSSTTAGSSSNPSTNSGSTGSTGSGSTGTSGTTGSTGSSGSGSSSGGSGNAAAKSVTLNWQAPTENNNGSTLTNLAGFKIHYGTASKDYSQVVALNNPGLSRYVVESLESGKYYFAISAYNSQGVESSMSGEVETTVD